MRVLKIDNPTSVASYASNLKQVQCSVCLNHPTYNCRNVLDIIDVRMFPFVDGSQFMLYPAPFFYGRNYFVEDNKYIPISYIIISNIALL